MRKSFLPLLAILALAAQPASAQTCPTTANKTPNLSAGGTVFAYMAGQWNAFFGSKADANGGVICDATLINPKIPLNLVPGGVLIGSSTGFIGQEPSDFFWDVANRRLGVRTNTPSVELDVAGDIRDRNVLSATVAGTNGSGVLFKPTVPAVLTYLGAVPTVADNAALAQTPTAGYTEIWRLESVTGAGAAPMAFRAQTGTCASHSMVNDVGSCTDTTGGNSWKAVYATSRFDIRQFGAKPDNTTPADAAMTAALAYSGGVGGCTYVPAVFPGFTFQARITVGSGTACLRGDRIKRGSIDAADALGGFADMHFPNDSDGVRIFANNGWDVGDFSIQGSAPDSAVATHTRGIFNDGSTEGRLSNIWVQDFVVCHEESYGAAEHEADGIFCRDAERYPNIKNDYPYAGLEMLFGKTTGGGGPYAAAAMQIRGGKYQAASENDDIVYTSDGATTWFQTCAPHTGPAQGSVGVTVNCNLGTPAGVPTAYMWAADGIKVWLGAATPLPNGQSWFAPANGLAGYKICGTDYSLFDVSQSGGSGVGGVPLYCKQLTSVTATLGSATLILGSLTGLQYGDNILADADHGLLSAAKLIGLAESATVGGTPTAGDVLNVTFTSGSLTGSPITVSYTVTSDDAAATYPLTSMGTGLAAAINANAVLTTAGIKAVAPLTFSGSGAVTIAYPVGFSVTFGQSVTGAATETITLAGGGNRVALNRPAYATDTLTVNLTQIAVATGGSPAYSQACQALLTCGVKIEVRFTVAPPNATEVNLTWLDPTGYAGLDIEGASDYIFARPTHVGGYRKGLKHIGLADGGVEWRPTYIEVLNQCVEIGGQTNNDLVDLHRVVNDPIPNCPGYVDPLAGNATVAFNNVPKMSNGATNGGATSILTQLPTTCCSFLFPSLNITPLRRPKSYLLECDGIKVDAPANVRVQFAEGSPPVYITNNYNYAGQWINEVNTTGTQSATGDSGISPAGVLATTDTLKFTMFLGRLGQSGIIHQAEILATVNGATHLARYSVSGSYVGDTDALTGISVTTGANVSGRCSLSGNH